MASEEQPTNALGHVVKAIDEMEANHGGVVKLAGAELGVENFGVQVFDFPPNFEHYPEHDHAKDGMEEVYLVLRGSADFEIDGDRVALDPERMLRVPAGTKRKLLPGPDGVRILAIGCTPGGTYERSDGLKLAAQREG